MASTTNHITTPTGNLVARLLIQRVSHIPDRGVMIYDGFGRMLEFIRIEENSLAIRVRDAFNEVVLDGKRAVQPDWSFLNPLTDNKE